MPHRLRLFIACLLPKPLTEALGRRIRGLERTGADVRFVPPRSLHLTLRFLGDVEDSCVMDTVAAVREAAAAGEPLRLSVHGLGVFPPSRPPRVVFAGLAGDLDALRALAARLERLLEPLGHQPERRPFVPHVTLGRVRSGRGADGLLAAVRAGADADFGAFTAGAVALMESHLSPGGAEHAVVARLPLGAGAPPVPEPED